MKYYSYKISLYPLVILTITRVTSSLTRFNPIYVVTLNKNVYDCKCFPIKEGTQDEKYIVKYLKVVY